MKSIIIILIVFTSFIGACKNKPAAFTERRFIIGNKETVMVKELGLSITNNGCGRKWMMSDNGKAEGEIPYCDIEIKYHDSVIHAGNNFGAIRMGDAEIILDRINPWGTDEDSVPAGGCRLWVRKIIQP